MSEFGGRAPKRQKRHREEQRAEPERRPRPGQQQTGRIRKNGGSMSSGGTWPGRVTTNHRRNIHTFMLYYWGELLRGVVKKPNTYMMKVGVDYAIC